MDGQAESILLLPASQLGGGIMKTNYNNRQATHISSASIVKSAAETSSSAQTYIILIRITT